jgi:hypothetical protein
VIDCGPCPPGGTDCVDASVADKGPVDKSVAPDSPPAGTKLLYRVTFEKGSIAADVGQSNALEMSGGSITVAQNPKKDSGNSSDNVGRHKTPSGYARAELYSQTLPIVDKTYSYKWSYYIPGGFFSGITWNLVSQWNTWPCAVNNGYNSEICGNDGIFNDLEATKSNFVFQYRAEPDCYKASPTMETDKWVTFVMVIKWTTSKGFVKLWKNNQLVYDKQGIKTLYDNYKPGQCDLYWTVGVYSQTQGGLELYTDNIEIWEGSIK